MNAKPFVKWAGGKSQLLPEIRSKYPNNLGKLLTKYCEPFVGGGAVLFDILSTYKIKEVLINDINFELINTYSHIKNHLDDILLDLSNIQDAFWDMDAEKRKKYYYEKRERYNFLKRDWDDAINLEKAVLFIFLNKTCFNGLYRVNKRGLFNVPVGAYKKPLICDKNNLRIISKLLENVSIQYGDYKECLSFIDSNTFVYIDPPYRPLTATSSFTSYAEASFNDKEQKELSAFVDNITAKDAKVVISNSDPMNNDTEDTFFDDLYDKYNVLRVTAKRMINCNGKSRGNVSELLISNYERD